MFLGIGSISYIFFLGLFRDYFGDQNFIGPIILFGNGALDFRSFFNFGPKITRGHEFKLAAVTALTNSRRYFLRLGSLRPGMHYQSRLLLLGLFLLLNLSLKK